jgi:hypothetical protein
MAHQAKHWQNLALLVLLRICWCGCARVPQMKAAACPASSVGYSGNMSTVKPSTNPIGKGTQNVTVNLLDEEKRILGRLALADDRSLSEFMRRLMLTGLRTLNPEMAARMDEVRRKHYDQMLLELK